VTEFVSPQHLRDLWDWYVRECPDVKIDGNQMTTPEGWVLVRPPEPVIPVVESDAMPFDALLAICSGGQPVGAIKNLKSPKFDPETEAALAAMARDADEHCDRTERQRSAVMRALWMEFGANTCTLNYLGGHDCGRSIMVTPGGELAFDTSGKYALRPKMTTTSRQVFAIAKTALEVFPRAEIVWSLEWSMSAYERRGFEEMHEVQMRDQLFDAIGTEDPK
jgi:hypothetical protein